MELTQDEVCAIIGAKELELVVLRRKVAQLEAKLKAAEKKADDPA